MTEGRPRVRDHLVRTEGRRSGHCEHQGQLRRVRLQPDVAVSLSISRSARMVSSVIRNGLFRNAA